MEGYRQKGGFVGEHDRTTGEPIPDHISAKWQDIEILMKGFFKTDSLLLKSGKLYFKTNCLRLRLDEETLSQLKDLSFLII